MICYSLNYYELEFQFYIKAYDNLSANACAYSRWHPKHKLNLVKIVNYMPCCSNVYTTRVTLVLRLSSIILNSLEDHSYKCNFTTLITSTNVGQLGAALILVCIESINAY
jgi:hypothetical protein